MRWYDPCTEEESSSIGFELFPDRCLMRLRYRLVGDDKSMDLDVPLSISDLPWGGIRWWFTCGMNGDERYCGRRVSKLFLPPEGRRFACRRCHGLTYKSCQESHKYDACDRRLARDIGVTVQEVRRMWKVDGPKEELDRRNKQRRRRRKARNWA